MSFFQKLFGPKTPKTPDAPPPPGEKVILHVYDLNPDATQRMPFGMGVYHSGVFVFGSEWSFGGGQGSGTGVFSSTPKDVPNAVFKEAIVIGETRMKYKEFQTLIEKMKREYAQTSYHLTGRNCNHFANDLCKRMTGNSIPSWVNRAASIGNLFSGLVPGADGGNPVPAPDAGDSLPTFVAFSGSGQTVTGKVVDEKKSAKISGPKEEAPDARRQRMLDAALRRTAEASSAAAAAAP
jgi:hypothetical protein